MEAVVSIVSRHGHTTVACYRNQPSKRKIALDKPFLLLCQAKLIYSLSSGLFLKCMWAGGHFSFFIISFGPVHVATETII